MSNPFSKPKRMELLEDALSSWEEPFPEREKPKGCQHAGMAPLEGKALREVMGSQANGRHIRCECGLVMGFEPE